MSQIWTTTCWCMSGIFAHMLWFEDGVPGGFWAGAHFVGMLLSKAHSMLRPGISDLKRESV